jgi:hypothetical protein
MAREDTTLTRLVVTASILLKAVLLAVVGAMAASDHAPRRLRLDSTSPTSSSLRESAARAAQIGISLVVRRGKRR